MDGHRVTGLSVPGQIATSSRGAWPYLDHPPDGGGSAREVELRAIPYYAWANRGPSDMRVWIPEGMGDDGPAG